MKALQFTLKYEGGWVNDKADPGGKTNYGISDAGDGTIDGMIDLDRDGDGDVKAEDLTREQAIKIYFDHYWKVAGCHRLELPMAVCVFDTAVNCGVVRALRWSKNETDFEQILFKRTHHYTTIIDRNPKLQRFFKGWINRVVDLRKYCEILSRDI